MGSDSIDQIKRTQPRDFNGVRPHRSHQSKTLIQEAGMTFDIPHMIATAVIVFIVIWGLDQTSLLDKMSKRKQTLTKFGVLFGALFVLNLVWPIGSGS